ncbi:malto-oligosyltrehalose synthase [Verticiella sediminum]|uniref:Malto-oligosyltrehalose synthase n=1 Tax=Verticiella sediminum TaxID=1247510 RepID=A0A556AS87_9BURK|nr:malto-oligosyltrehalose synthase [Verticiella sediminum]TSH95797.1 malto-oligosyltrehalose synthase [Verticiella sediminum]
MNPPRATVRLQFHQGFTLDDAEPLVGYFADLGISHIYASPLTEARAGSTHGYDVIDPRRIGAAVGGELALRRLVARLRGAGMGLILDIVPNHMATGAANTWWWDVLRWGRGSHYAGHFDIDWESSDPALRGKVLAPFLGAAYGEELSEGRLKLAFDAESGEFEIHYYDNRFPVTPESYAAVFGALPPSPTAQGLVDTFARLAQHSEAPTRQAAVTTLREAAEEPGARACIEAAIAAHDPRDAAGRSRLHALLESQHYRLTWWRNAAEQINWRRFFEISDLAGVRVEEPQVFDDVHALVIRLWAEGVIDGVRIDHVDGLTDPRRYCRKLRAALRAVAASRPAGLEPEPYILVEKILGEDEALPQDWQVDGTSGYDFMAQVGGVLHDARGEPPLTRLWREISGEHDSFHELVRDARRMLITRHFAGEYENLMRALHRIAQESPLTRDWSRAAIRRTLLELLVAFPVYRTYGGLDGRTAADAVFFAHAVREASAHLQTDDQVLLELIDDWLGGRPPSDLPPGPRRNARLTAIRRFQQLTAPLAAKSLEDTVFFRYGRLLSRNEVGAEPSEFALDVVGFHTFAQARAERFPHAMLSTATHDHKRGEDARARLAAISEVPQRWQSLTRGWLTSRQDAPHVVDQYMLLHTLIAAWPLSLEDEPPLEHLRERVEAWQIKSLREGKLRSNWFAPDTGYEERCSAFLAQRLQDARWRQALAEFVELLAPVGALKGLSQALLRTTLPGVPDLYQGTEFWDFSLTDPDNRRPVDFQARMRALGGSATPVELLAHWRDGRVKQAMLQRALGLRRTHAALFAAGGYEPVQLEGEWADGVIAFRRQRGEQRLLVIAPRLGAGILTADAAPAERTPLVPAQAWQDTRLSLRDDDTGLDWRSVFDASPLPAQAGGVALRDALAAFPVQLYYTDA